MPNIQKYKHTLTPAGKEFSAKQEIGHIGAPRPPAFLPYSAPPDRARSNRWCDLCVRQWVNKWESEWSIKRLSLSTPFLSSTVAMRAWRFSTGLDAWLNTVRESICLECTSTLWMPWSTPFLSQLGNWMLLSADLHEEVRSEWLAVCTP